jgi:hypothetical protein
MWLRRNFQPHPRRPGRDCRNACDRGFVRYLSALLANPDGCIRVELQHAACRQAFGPVGGQGRSVTSGVPLPPFIPRNSTAGSRRLRRGYEGGAQSCAAGDQAEAATTRTAKIISRSSLTALLFVAGTGRLSVIYLNKRYPLGSAGRFQ